MLGLQYAGAIYQIMSGGKQRRLIFRDDQDRPGFLAEVGRTREETNAACSGQRLSHGSGVCGC
jgi:hypothetical protein